jgi:hypothetical protein
LSATDTQLTQQEPGASLSMARSGASLSATDTQLTQQEPGASLSRQVSRREAAADSQESEGVLRQASRSREMVPPQDYFKGRKATQRPRRAQVFY